MCSNVIIAYHVVSNVNCDVLEGVHRRFFSSTKTQKHTFPAQKRVPFLVYNVQGLGVAYGLHIQKNLFPALGVFSVLLSVPISFLIPAKKHSFFPALGFFSVLLSSFLIPAFLFLRKH